MGERTLVSRDCSRENGFLKKHWSTEVKAWEEKGEVKTIWRNKGMPNNGEKEKWPNQNILVGHFKIENKTSLCNLKLTYRE